MDVMLTRIVVEGGDAVFYDRPGKSMDDVKEEAVEKEMEDEEIAELTDDEKRSLLTQIFADDRALFIERYSRWILPTDVPLFAGESDPIAAYLLRQISRPPKVETAPEATATNEKATVRNRRYNAMQQLIKEGAYFSDEKMREREPFLYDKLVGRFLTDEERLELRPTLENVDEAQCASSTMKRGGWAGLLTQFEESSDIAHRRAAKNEEWDSACKSDAHSRLMAHVNQRIDEDDDDDDFVEEEDEGIEGERMATMKKEVNGIIRRMDEATAAEETMLAEEAEEEEVPRETLRAEFLALMEERFLGGLDSRFFDYDAVDCDNTDDVIAERDREEAWFEDEEGNDTKGEEKKGGEEEKEEWETMVIEEGGK